MYLTIILAVVFGAANRSGAQEVTVSVAISMKDAIEELGRQFQKARPTVVLRFNLGASGELQKQIEAGAPADLFILSTDGQRVLSRFGFLPPSPGPSR